MKIESIFMSMIRRLALVFLVVALLAAVVAVGSLYWFLSSDAVRVALERQASAWLGQPVHVGAARAQIFPRVAIRLEQLQIGAPARITLAEVEVSTALRALLMRRISDANVRVRNSRIDFPLPFSFPTRGGTGAPIAGRAGGSVRIESVKSIVLQDVLVTSRGHQIRVSADSSLLGNQLALRQLTAVSSRSSIRAEGVIELEPRVDAKLRVRAERFDLDELLALADAFSGSAESKVTTPPARSPLPAAALTARISARVSAETGSVGGVSISQFATNLELDGDRVALSPLTLQLFGGRYEGSLNATLRRTLAVTLRSKIVDLDVARLASFGNAADTVTGRLSGAGSFTGAGRDFADVLRTAHGSGSAQIVDGEVRRLNLVRTVVLFFGRPAANAPSEASDRFDRIDLRFTLADQVFRAEAFSLRSPDADIVGTGTLTVPTKALEGTLDLSLSEALSAQAGRDFYRYTREGNRIVVPARIGGSLTSPRIAIDAEAALERGLRNEVERRLKGFVDRIEGR